MAGRHLRKTTLVPLGRQVASHLDLTVPLGRQVGSHLDLTVPLGRQVASHLDLTVPLGTQVGSHLDLTAVGNRCKQYHSSTGSSLCMPAG